MSPKKPGEAGKAPSLQWYPDKWLAGTRRLSWHAKGIYKDLLDIIWLHHQETCSIPDDDEYIAAELGCDLDFWKTAKAEIMCIHKPLLVQTETFRLLSKGLLREREKQLVRRDRLRKAGRKGGRPRKTPEKPEVVQKKGIERLSSPTPTTTPATRPCGELEEELLPVPPEDGQWVKEFKTLTEKGMRVEYTAWVAAHHSRGLVPDNTTEELGEYWAECGRPGPLQAKVAKWGQLQALYWWLDDVMKRTGRSRPPAVGDTMPAGRLS